MLAGRFEKSIQNFNLPVRQAGIWKFGKIELNSPAMGEGGDESTNWFNMTTVLLEKALIIPAPPIIFAE